MKIRIASADDHAIVRDGIRAMCLVHPDFDFVFEASDCEGFRKLLVANPIDVAVVDIQLPDGSGIDLCKSIKNSEGDISVLVFSGFMDEDTILRAISAGASGYVSKDASLIELRTAIEHVSRGEQFFSISVGEILYRSYLRKQMGRTSDRGSGELSEREVEVLKLFAEGMSYKEIAAKLFISPRTVETHKENIMMKLSLQTLADLIKYAIREKLISL